MLLSNYRAEFTTVRLCFLAGVVTMMGAIGVRAWAEFEPPLAAAATLLFAAAGAAMASSNRETVFEFERVKLLGTERASLRESFADADTNSDGLLSVPELARAMQRGGIAVSEAQARRLVARCAEDAGVEGCDARTESLDLEGFTRLVREFDSLFEEWVDDSDDAGAASA